MMLPHLGRAKVSTFAAVPLLMLLALSARAQVDAPVAEEPAQPAAAPPPAEEPAAPAPPAEEAAPRAAAPPEEPKADVAPTPKEETVANAADAAPQDPEVSDAELENFMAESNLGGEGFDPSLSISGFADFSYEQFLIPNDSPWRFVYNNKGAFHVGNLNLYFDARLSETIRSLVEIRFTYLPHGNVTSLGPPAERLNNSSSDYTRNERDVRIGGVIIERAFIEWAPHQLFSIKAGQWLTPYGIWNVDHGSPTIIPVQRPFMIDENLMPESQAGLLAEGRLELSDRVALEYGAGISNGRGPIDMYFDYDANRGLTGRLKLQYHGVGELQIGTSGYIGKFTESELGITQVDDTLESTEEILYQYDETTIAADLRYGYKGFLFQSEFAMNDRRFTDAGRPLGNLPNSLQADSRRWGIYGLTGYRFEWLGLMPYFLGEFSPVPDTSIPQLPQKVLLLGGGLNIRPTGPLVFKVGYTQTLFPDKRPGTFDEHTLRRVQAMVAWAF